MALHFYRALNAPVKVLSFDLDDTLYYNDDVIQQAEQAQFETICSHIPAVKKAGITPWLSLKWQVLKSDPELKHDVTAWRKAVIEAGLINFKSSYSEQEWKNLINLAFQAFYDARSDFKVEPQVLDTLNKLKQKYPLIAVTNGNVDIERIGLAQYFVAYYRAGEQGNRMKPWSDMLQQASQELDIPCRNILHIGDNVSTDLKAAQRAGCPSLWFNPNGIDLPANASLPNAEYSHLDDLLQLL